MTIRPETQTQSFRELATSFEYWDLIFVVISIVIVGGTNNLADKAQIGPEIVVVMNLVGICIGAAALFTFLKKLDGKVKLTQVKVGTVEESIKTSFKLTQEKIGRVEESIKTSFELYPQITLLEVAQQSNDLGEIHLRASIEAQKKAVQTIIKGNGTSILHFVRNNVKEMEITHMSPTYSLMKEIAKLLEDGYIYAATSKLKSYETSIDDTDFDNFNVIIMDHAKQGKSIVSRLYYVDGMELQEKTATDIRKAMSSNINCRYKCLERQAFDQKKDIAIVLAPDKTSDNRHDVIKQGRETFSQGRYPIKTLRDTNNWRLVCVMEFDLTPAKGGLTVNKVSIFSESHDSSDTLIREFDAGWCNGNNILPPISSSIRYRLSRYGPYDKLQG